MSDSPRTITTKFVSKCAQCGSDIPKDTVVAYVPGNGKAKGTVYHLTCRSPVIATRLVDRMGPGGKRLAAAAAARKAARLAQRSAVNEQAVEVLAQSNPVKVGEGFPVGRSPRARRSKAASAVASAGSDTV